MYVPVHDLKHNIIGICGFEVSDLYFQLSEKVSDDKLGQLTGALLDEKQGVYSGQFNSSQYNITNSSIQSYKENNITIFDFNPERCIGKTAKEIVEILGIKENTLKYHNKNIYSKLGISSRKQLLRFAALKQHQDKIGVSDT